MWSDDLVLVNANVVTLDPGKLRAQAIAIRNGKILEISVEMVVVDGKIVYSS